jgi:hypothetical protein
LKARAQAPLFQFTPAESVEAFGGALEARQAVKLFFFTGSSARPKAKTLKVATFERVKRKDLP